MWIVLVEVSSHTSSVSWLVLGDFNVTLNMQEHSDYFLGMPVSHKVVEFQDYISTFGLTDLHGSGPFYTWSNKRVVVFFG